MRFTMYAGASAALAGGVLLRAMHQRANFYSATVYLSQSNACLMILTNLALLGVATVFYGLQRLCFGALRPIEIEQLYEKAWFAITETCLAMTIFREEVGAWFLVMFVALLIGKVWAWIGEGRVEVLEQQPPANPRLFHIRLSVSLVTSISFDFYMLQYCVETVLRQARPNMMVMFAFEFAVLSVMSMSTLGRYAISLWEANVITGQIKARRDQTRQQRRREAETGSEATTTSVPSEEDVDTMDFDVPGWEEKGRYVFYLDLMTDFFKLVLYLTFFCVLCMFYGMPIHIIRDVALTIRSFYKRISDFVRYRQATKDMHDRYPDATAEEIAREDCCIICREDMTPWTQAPSPGNGQAQGSERVDPAQPPLDERLRPKKLPCGHVLHFACLRSWLERQQNCPTCRRPVLESGVVARVPRNGNVPGVVGPGVAPQQQQQRNFILNDGGQHPIIGQNVFNFGPFRLAFGARMGPANPPHNQIPENQPGNNNVPMLPQLMPNAPRRPPAPISMSSTSLIPQQLDQMERQIMQEILSLQTSADQLLLVRTLQLELQRLRAARNQPNAAPSATSGNSLPSVSEAQPSPQVPPPVMFSSQHQQQPMGPGHENLPPGMTLPEGWTILPLQRSDVGRLGAPSPSVSHPATSHSPSPSTLQHNSGSGATSTLVSQSPQTGSSSTQSSDTTQHGNPLHANSAVPPHPPFPFLAATPSTADAQQPSLTNAHSPAIPSLPNWAAGQSNGADHAASSMNGSAAPGPSANGTFSDEPTSTSERRSEKGKGRATTVEDGDDLD